MEVLFVCTANICRSAYAEVMARHLAPNGLSFASAGVHGLPAASMEGLMAGEAEARGALTSGFRSRPLTMAMVEAADLVLTAETRHRRLILEERPLAMRKAFTFGQFARGLSLLADPTPDPTPDLLAAVRARAATSTVADDVADPYGRGPAAVATAALELDDLLGQILPALTRAAS